jgi:hypothetical protein
MSKLLQKIASSIDLSFDIPDSEKKIARETIEHLNSTYSSLKIAADHLDIIYEPFESHTDISPESIIKNRGVIDRYKQKIKENYNKMKEYALYSIRSLNEFSSDSKIKEIVDAFRSSISDLEDSVVKLLETLSDYESTTYRDDVVKQIETIKEYTDNTRELIKDRIIQHVETNILADSWLENTEKMLEEKENQIPKTQPGQNLMVDPAKKEQQMNPSDASGVYYPDQARTRQME